LPGYIRCRERSWPGLLEPGEEVRKLLEIGSFETVIAHSVLVGPDARQYAGPSWPADRVRSCRTLGQDPRLLGESPIAYESMQVRGPGCLQRIRSTTVDPDDEHLFGWLASLKDHAIQQQSRQRDQDTDCHDISMYNQISL